MTTDVFMLSDFPVHLGLVARVVRLHRFTGSMDWHMEYGKATDADSTDIRPR